MPSKYIGNDFLLKCWICEGYDEEGYICDEHKLEELYKTNNMKEEI